jgi:hypothetical protein
LIELVDVGLVSYMRDKGQRKEHRVRPDERGPWSGANTWLAEVMDAVALIWEERASMIRMNTRCGCKDTDFGRPHSTWTFDWADGYLHK